jgi:hypothetical protein
VAFGNVSKIALRRLDGPQAKSAATLLNLLDLRTEILMSLHLLINLLWFRGPCFWPCFFL